MFPLWFPNGNDVNSGFFDSTSSMSVYTVRITIWECPGWEGANEHSNKFLGAQCNGPLLTSAP
jgi:hypothetical protein